MSAPETTVAKREHTTEDQLQQFQWTGFVVVRNPNLANDAFASIQQINQFEYFTGEKQREGERVTQSNLHTYANLQGTALGNILAVVRKAGNELELDLTGETFHRQPWLPHKEPSRVTAYGFQPGTSLEVVPGTDKVSAVVALEKELWVCADYGTAALQPGDVAFVNQPQYHVEPRQEEAATALVVAGEHAPRDESTKSD